VPKPFEIRLIFDNEEHAKDFVAAWLVGGGEYACGFSSVYEESDKWDKRTPRFLKLERSEDEGGDGAG
jgi:hypothetical protein